MLIEVAPALILAAAVVVLVFVVGSDAWAGLRGPMGRDPAAPEGDRATLEREGREPATGPGSPSAPQAAPPARMVTVGAWRSASAAVQRPSMRGGSALRPALGPATSPDPRRLLWRDTAFVTVAIGLVIFVSSSLPRSAPQGAVLGETFPAILGTEPTPAATSGTATASPGSSATPAAIASPAATTAPPRATQPAAAAPTPGALPSPRPTATASVRPSPTAAPSAPPSSPPPPTPTASPPPTPTPEPTPEPTPTPEPAP